MTTKLGRPFTTLLVTLVTIAGASACGSSDSPKSSGANGDASGKSGGASASASAAPARQVRLEKPCRDLDVAATTKVLGVSKLNVSQELAPGDRYKDLEGKKTSDFYNCYVSTYDPKHYKPGATAYATLIMRDLSKPTSTKLPATAKAAVEAMLSTSQGNRTCTAQELPEEWGTHGGSASCTQKGAEAYNRDAYTILTADFDKVRVTCTAGRFGDKPTTTGESMADQARTVCTAALKKLTS